MRKIIFLTNELLSAKLLTMKMPHKKITSALLPIPFLFAITFCCCLDEKAFAGETHLDLSTEHHQESHELEKSDHTEHQGHSHGDHECTCPKHLSFLYAQSADIVFYSSLSQMLAKNFMGNFRLENIVFLTSLSNHSQDPPLQDHLDYVSLPIYLEISNLRI